MKLSFSNHFLSTKVLLYFCLLLAVSAANAQCGMALKDIAVQGIGNSTYLKDFRVRLEQGKNPSKPDEQEFSILLNKGTHYRFTIKADSVAVDKPVLKLYDFTRFYGSNYDKTDGTSYEYFDFFCAKTQVYYLSISFATAGAGCAAAIVSFVGNYDAN